MFPEGLTRTGYKGSGLTCEPAWLYSAKTAKTNLFKESRSVKGEFQSDILPITLWLRVALVLRDLITISGLK